LLETTVSSRAPLLINMNFWNAFSAFPKLTAPRAVFPTIFGCRRIPSPVDENFFCGDSALSKRGILNLRKPIVVRLMRYEDIFFLRIICCFFKRCLQKGEIATVASMSDLEQLWRHVYSKELDRNPAEHSVLLVEPGR
jgi:hypothetical protein